MIVKVKEAQPGERRMRREGQVLFAYLHLAADRTLTQGLVESGCVAVAYETVTDDRGGLPLLAPMSEVAGRMSIQVGAHCLEKEPGGRGVLLGGVTGVPSADVVILGGGVVGVNAARIALGMEARVTVVRSEEHTSVLQSLMRSSYDVFCLTKKYSPNQESSHRIGDTYDKIDATIQHVHFE